MSRTNIEIDDELIERVMYHYNLSSKKDAVHFALSRVDVTPMTKDEVLAMQGSGFEMSNDELEEYSNARW